MAPRGKALRAQLAALAAQADDHVELAPVALAIAQADHPSADPADYLDHLDILAERLCESGAASADDRACALAATLAGLYGYGPSLASEGDGDGEGESDGDLIVTIDTRTGGGESLGIVALEAMRRAGWSADAILFPCRFLIRIEDGEGHRLILDPAAGWATVETHQLRAWLKAQAGLASELSPALWQPLSNRSILVRLQNGAKVRFLKAGHLDRALSVIETTLLFAPSIDALWREAGVLHARLNHVAAAVAALEHFLMRCADQETRARTQQMLAELRQRIV